METISIPNNQVVELIENDQPFEISWIGESATIVPVPTPTGLELLIIPGGMHDLGIKNGSESK